MQEDRDRDEEEGQEEDNKSYRLKENSSSLRGAVEESSQLCDTTHQSCIGEPTGQEKSGGIDLGYGRKPTGGRSVNHATSGGLDTISVAKRVGNAAGVSMRFGHLPTHKSPTRIVMGREDRDKARHKVRYTRPALWVILRPLLRAFVCICLYVYMYIYIYIIKLTCCVCPPSQMFIAPHFLEYKRGTESPGPSTAPTHDPATAWMRKHAVRFDKRRRSVAEPIREVPLDS
jgi:hypothetical protein